MLGESYAVIGVDRADYAEAWITSPAGFTIIALVRTTDTSPYDGLWGVGDDMRMDQLSNDVRFKIEGKTATSTGNKWPVTGEPTFFCGRMDAARVIDFFVDSELVATNSPAGPWSSSQFYFNIGSYYNNVLGGEDAEWLGFWFYDWALTDAQVAQHHADPWCMFRRASPIELYGSLGGAPGGATVNLGVLEAVAELNAPTITPGAVTTSLGALEAQAELLDPTVAPGAVTVQTDVLEAQTELLDPTLTPGAVTVSPGVLEAVAELLDVVVSTGDSTVNLGVLEAVAEILTPTLTPGSVSIEPGVLEAVAELMDPTIAPGAVTIPLDALEAVTELLDPTLTPGAVTLALEVLVAIAELNAPVMVGGTGVEGGFVVRGGATMERSRGGAVLIRSRGGAVLIRSRGRRTT